MTDLNLLPKPGGFDLNEGCGDRLHVAGLVVEGDTAGPDGIFILVRVQPSVDHTLNHRIKTKHHSNPLPTLEEIIEDHGESLGRHHAVQSSYEHSLLRIEPGGIAADVVGV